ncbi:MAG: hypothetical protein V1676_02640 [Candidatus Diapherotrites archaeon]
MVANITIENPSDSDLSLQSLMLHSEQAVPTVSRTYEMPRGETKSITLYNFKIDETYENGEYLIIARLVDPQNPDNVLDSRELAFSITGLPEKFVFDLESCRDRGCAEKSKIFVKGEIIYLNFESGIEGPEISAMLIFPGKTTQQILLPYSLKAEQLGSYRLEATASAEGCKTMQKTFQFVVIEKHAEIPSASRCNGNHVCDAGENAQNCPQDCPGQGAGIVNVPMQPAEPPAGFDWLPVIGVVVLIAVLAVAYFKVFKPRQ